MITEKIIALLVTGKTEAYVGSCKDYIISFINRQTPISLRVSNQSRSDVQSELLLVICYNYYY